MLRYVRLLVVLVLASITALSCVAVQNSPAPIDRKAVLEAAYSCTIVLLDKKRADLWTGTVCAGVRIAPKILLTAHHCSVAGAWTADELVAFALVGKEPPVLGKELRFVEHAFYNGYRLDEGRQVSAVVYAFDEKHDAALAYTEDESLRWVHVRSYPAEVDEEVFTIGHPSGDLYHLTSGRVGHDQRRISGGWFTHVDITIWFGNSGGGLFDQHGRLVGIASAFSSPSSSFFVHQERIAELLKASKRPTEPIPTPEAPDSGLEVESAD